jgi:hypothetical protein
MVKKSSGGSKRSGGKKKVAGKGATGGGFTVDLKPARKAVQKLRDELIANQAKASSAKSTDRIDDLLDTIRAFLRAAVCQDESMTRKF